VDEQFLHPTLLGGVPSERMADRARPPVWSGPVPARRREDESPTVVLFSEDEPTRERVQALLRLVGLQVQLFGTRTAGEEETSSFSPTILSHTAARHSWSRRGKCRRAVPVRSLSLSCAARR
jgi:hypothetical protein